MYWSQPNGYWFRCDLMRVCHSVFHSHPHRTSDFPLLGMWLPNLFCFVHYLNDPNHPLSRGFFRTGTEWRDVLPIRLTDRTCRERMFIILSQSFLDFTLTVLAFRIHSALFISIHSSKWIWFLGLGTQIRSWITASGSVTPKQSCRSAVHGASARVALRLSVSRL